MAELNFYWRMGDYALEAVPKRLVRFHDEDQNETIDLVKYYNYQGRECKYSIGYFRYNENEPCWELKFVGDRFKELRKTDLVALFEMLAAAYDTLEAWSIREEDKQCD